MNRDSYPRKSAFYWILIITGFLLIAQSCAIHKSLPGSDIFKNAEPQVRVRIINTVDTIHIRFLTTWTAYSSIKQLYKFNTNDQITITLIDDQIIVYRIGSPEETRCDSLKLKADSIAGELEIKNVPYGTGWWWAGQENRTYQGEISVYPLQSNKPEVIVKLAMEDYLCGVVPYEIGGDSPLDALKAQSVAARSEAVMALKSDLYRGKHHDLTSDVECQVFSGNHKRTENSDRAVAETRGLILADQDQPINAYYASNCGGHSELISNIWPDRPAPGTYLSGGSDTEERHNLDLSSEEKVREWIFSQPDVYCNPEKNKALPFWSRRNFRWKKIFAIDSLSKMISGSENLGQLIAIKALKRGVSGRMYQARFIFEQDSLDVSGELAIRQMWHPALRSACFVVDREGENFILNGAGWGHGVGMCQSGAVAQAIRGKSYKTILQHYYPKISINSIY
jgi:stage II sporulation protein D